MKRDMEKYKLSQDVHYEWQFDYFNVIKNKVIQKARWHKDMFYDLETWDALLTEAENMKFQFDRNEAKINYGKCEKLNKGVSFIPNILQLETQDCFKHRKNE